jgi:hypothetical protein
VNLLIAFLLCGVAVGLFTKSLDWRGYLAFVGAGLVVTGIFLVDGGAW